MHNNFSNVISFPDGFAPKMKKPRRKKKTADSFKNLSVEFTYKANNRFISFAYANTDFPELNISEGEAVAFDSSVKPKYGDIVGIRFNSGKQTLRAYRPKLQLVSDETPDETEETIIGVVKYVLRRT